MRRRLILLAAAALAGCGFQTIGQPPEMTSIGRAEEDAPPILTAERVGLAVPPPQPARYAYQQASLWSTGPTGLLGDRRAKSLGDILTVTIEIDDKAEMKNETERNREAISAAQDWFFERGYVSRKVDLDQIIDPQFADYAVAQLGPYRR